jgi:drug/metabolite transporter (DMT)-like permease
MANEKEKIRRGPKTSEFWATAIASVLGLCIMAGWINPEGVGTVDKLAGLACAALASMGYAVSRGLAKSGKDK